MTDPRLKNILAHSEETITKTIPEKQSEPIIRVDKASRVYQVGTNNVNALREISIEIPKGVLAALKGRSGSGKTTLLNLIGGLDKPTSGTVSLFGEPLFKMTGDQLTDFAATALGLSSSLL